METKTLPIPPEVGQELGRIQSSIQRQSVVLGQAVIRCREVESGLQTLYDHQQGIIGQFVEKAGLNPEAIAYLSLSPDGRHVVVLMKPEQPQPAAPPATGS